MTEQHVRQLREHLVDFRPANRSDGDTVRHQQSFSPDPSTNEAAGGESRNATMLLAPVGRS